MVENRLKVRYYLRDLFVNRVRINDTRVLGLNMVDAGGFEKILLVNPERREDVNAIE